ncbi:MAG: ATP-dependent DNA ligase [Candidatus Diapherotrites archaeon]
MLFHEIAETFNKIETTTSRLKIAEHLSEIFKKAKKEEIKEITYLFQGSLGPKHAGIEAGLGEMLIEEAIAKATGYTKEQIEKKYKETGDLGIVAQELTKNKKQKTFFKQELTTKKVFSNLVKIAETKGKGSQEIKLRAFAELLNSATPQEAKYIVRFPLGNLRLGIGDPTIIDAMAINYTTEIKDKEIETIENQEEKEKKARQKIKEKIEEKYNIYSDLGEIAQKLKEKGLKGLEEIQIKPGIPIRPTLAERLNSAEEIIEKLGKCAVEQKIDGFRIQCHKDQDKIIIFSRQSENMTEMFPEIVQAIKEQVKAKTIIFEGEAIAYNENTNQYYPFQITIQRKRKYDIGEKAEEFPLKLFAFDIMYLDGQSLMEKKFKERRQILEKIISKGKVISLTQSIETNDPKKLEEYFLESIEQGLEGIIAKDLEAQYIAGARKFAWIKLKRSYKGELKDTIDVTIIGYYKGKGKRTEFGIGGLLTAVYDQEKDTFKSICKIGTGMTEEMLKELETKLSKITTKQKPSRIESEIEPDAWVEPKYVIEVVADEITKSPLHTTGKKNGTGYALRFPRMIKFREKKPEESTTEKEIIEMYEHQTKKSTETTFI